MNVGIIKTQMQIFHDLKFDLIISYNLDLQSAKILMLPVTISPLHFKSHFLYHAIEINSLKFLKL